jgi:hypothetical protein
MQGAAVGLTLWRRPVHGSNSLLATLITTASGVLRLPRPGRRRGSAGEAPPRFRGLLGRHSVGGAESRDPLVGAWMPDLPLTTGGRQTRVSDLMHDGQAVLLDLAGDPALARIPLPPGVSRRRAETPEDVDAHAVLIRPDGHLCWIAPTGPMSAKPWTNCTPR